MDPVELNPNHAVSPSVLATLLGQPDTPLILDLRRTERFDLSPSLLPSAVHVAPQDLADWLKNRPPQAAVVYCVYGHEVSQSAAAQLRNAGWGARYLLGGIEGGEPGVDSPALLQALSASPAPLLRKRPDLGVTGVGGSRWITRSRPKIDRIACPWLIRRFIDPQAKFLWLDDPQQCPPQALGFDFDGAAFTHVGTLPERVSFEVLAASFGLESDPALARIAAIVHCLDVGGVPVAEAAGIEAVLGGLRADPANSGDDDQLLAAASRVFDGLYTNYSKETTHD